MSTSLYSLFKAELQNSQFSFFILLLHSVAVAAAAALTTAATALSTTAAAALLYAAQLFLKRAVVLLVALELLAADATRELNVLGHDGDALGVYRAHICVFKNAEQVFLGGCL